MKAKKRLEPTRLAPPVYSGVTCGAGPSLSLGALGDIAPVFRERKP
jgi:hypothetical protein